jgi:hypothetical protein
VRSLVERRVHEFDVAVGVEHTSILRLRAERRRPTAIC